MASLHVNVDLRVNVHVPLAFPILFIMTCVHREIHMYIHLESQGEIRKASNDNSHYIFETIVGHVSDGQSSRWSRAFTRFLHSTNPSIDGR